MKINENETISNDVLYDYSKDELEVKLGWKEVLDEAFLSVEGFDDALARAIEALMDKRDSKEAFRFFIKTRERVAKELAAQFVAGHEVHGRAGDLLEELYARLMKRIFNREGV